MARKTIKADLSVKGLQQLQKELEKYKNDIVYKTQIFAEKLSERGVEIARVKISTYDAIFTGELIQSIHNEYKESEKYGATFIVVTDSEHAAFVEFGTGQYGIDVPYPYPLPQGVTWDYAVGKTIKKNSVTGRYFWFYPGTDGKWHYTEGMPARPFMFETSMELMQVVTQVAREVFG